MNPVATSYLLAIWANRDTGEPYTGEGRIGHVVRVGPNPRMPVVLEFSDGGAFAHEDCAPACMESRFIEQGIEAPIRTVEQLAGTGLGGTKFNPGCLNALRHFGVGAALSVTAPPPGWIMNPMLPAIVAASEFPRYLAASQGGCLIMAGYTPAPPPSPPLPPPSEEDTVQIYLEAAGNPNGLEFAEVGGIRAGQTIHLVPQDRTGLVGKVLMVSSISGGTPERNLTVALGGTLPGKHGPISADVPTSELVALTAFNTITFENESAFRVLVTITTP